MSTEYHDQKLEIKLLDKVYQVKCPPERVSSLQEAAKTLDGEMRKMRETGVVGLDRVAVIAGLNLANRCNEAEKQIDECVRSVNDRVKSLQHRIDDVLTSAEQLELE